MFCGKNSRKMKISVIGYMHFYACPYCPPSKKSNLIRIEDATHEEWDEEGNSTDLFSYECKKCKEHFLGTEDFLVEQKRKIKDG